MTDDQTPTFDDVVNRAARAHKRREEANAAKKRAEKEWYEARDEYNAAYNVLKEYVEGLVERLANRDRTAPQCEVVSDPFFVIDPATGTVRQVQRHSTEAA